MCVVYRCREVFGLAIANPHTSLHQKQHTHKYVICRHIAHNNGISIILTRDFSKEQYVLPDDDVEWL